MLPSTRYLIQETTHLHCRGHGHRGGVSQSGSACTLRTAPLDWLPACLRLFPSMGLTRSPAPFQAAPTQPYGCQLCSKTAPINVALVIHVMHRQSFRFDLSPRRPARRPSKLVINRIITVNRLQIYNILVSKLRHKHTCPYIPTPGLETRSTSRSCHQPTWP